MLADLTLYGYWRSSATWRVRLGLHHKGAQFRSVPVHLARSGGEQHSEGHLQLNPLGQVPVLAWTEGDVPMRLTQSMAILELIDEAIAGPALLPDGRLGRARARQLAELVNSGIQPLQNLLVIQELGSRGIDGADFSTWAIRRGLDAMQREMELAGGLPPDARPGRFLVGDAPSIADFCLIPQLYNARRFGLDVDRWPALRAVEEHASVQAAFLLAHADAQSDAIPG